MRNAYVVKKGFDSLMRRLIFVVILILGLSAMASANNYVLVTILHTNDLHGQVVPQSDPGLAKISTMIRGIRSEMPNVLLFDGGDAIQGTYEDYLTGGMATISAMNAAGYTVMAAGNHEFDFGLPVTSAVVKAATFPVLAANIKDRATGGSWNGIPPYAIVTISGVKIGVIGLVTTELVELEWPPSIAAIRVDDPIATAKTLVPELRKKVDVVVVLSHLGYTIDTALASSVGGIDFIVGGHSHTVLDKWEWVRDTLITQAGAYSRYLGRIDFIVDVDATGNRLLSVNGKNGRLWNDLQHPALGKVYPTSPLIPVPKTLMDDPAVVAVYKPYRDRTNVVLDEVIGEAVQVVPSTASAGESPAGDLVADAVRAAAKSDVALVDIASIASGLSTGKITRRAAFNMIGGFTRQQIVAVQVKGSDLLAALNGLLKNNTPGLSISGLTLSYLSAPENKILLSNVMVNSTPVDPNKDYTVAGQAYVIQEYILKVYPAAPIVAELPLTTREAIVNYIIASGKVGLPVMGRINQLQPPSATTTSTQKPNGKKPKSQS